VADPRWFSITCGLIVALSAVRPLGAQRRGSLEVGVSAVRFPVDSSRAFGPFVSWTTSGNTLRSFFSASANVVIAPAGASGSFAFGAGRRSLLPEGWLGEVSAELSALAGPASRAASSLLAAARLLRPIREGGGWLRLSGDVASREAGRLGGEGVDVGAWWRWPRVQVTTSLAQQWNMAQLFIGRSRDEVVGTVPVRYTEAGISLRVESDDASLDVAASVRRDRDAPQLYAPAVSATAALWQTSTRAIVVSVAHQLPDFIHGADAVDYVSVGMRLNERSPRAVREERSRPIVQVSGSDSSAMFTVKAPGARTVEIMGDFTNWEPVALVPRNGAFVAPVTLTRGSHRVVVRINGGEWKPAANTPAVDDDLGGRVGLLLVP
jgi:hypothetical protein